MPAELEESPTDTSTDTGALAATQDSDVEATATPDAGAVQANPTDATDPSSTTNDTSSESPEDLLERAARGAIKAPPQIPPAQDQAAQAPIIPPELQNLLKDPEEVKRLTNLNSLYGRQAAELGQYRQLAQSYQGLPPPDQLRAQLQRQQQEAEAAKIKPWNPRHPDFQRTNSRLSNVRGFQGARSEILADPELTPEQKNRLVGNLAQRSGVTADDVKLLQEHEAYSHEVKAELERDPDAFVTSRVEHLITQRLAQFEEFQQQRTQSQQFIQENMPVIEKHKDAMLWAMSHENRRDVGLRLAQVEAERDALLEKFTKNAGVVETAKAQAQYTKSRATVKRDAAVADAPSIANVIKTADAKKLSNAQLLDELYKARGMGS